jgi:conjugative relaxase-like TrwC/TraI family protein
MRVMHAGQGYLYLLKTVAAGDGDRNLATPLTRYYQADGTPPGVWAGTGVAQLGDGALRVGEQVTEAHLERLLGNGRDPVTGDKLGNGFGRYRTVEERIASRLARLDPALSDPERQAAVARIAAAEESKKQRRPVVGYDLTFSVPKTVSALWGVADAGTQALIAACHHAAVAEVLDFVERRVAETRVGAKNPQAGAVAQAEVRGVAATGFDHWDSRAGDPQLHTHMVVSSRVKTAGDGMWRALDGRPVHGAVVALSELYNALLADRITASFGLEWEHRERGRDRNPGFELAAVPDVLATEFSSRSAAINQAKEDLVAAYRERHGRDPGPRAAIRLRQQATLETRPHKQSRSLADLAAGWRARATGVLGWDAGVWARRTVAYAADRRPCLLRADDVPLDLVEQLGASVMVAVGDKQGTWRRWNLHAEATRQTIHWRFATLADREAVLDLIADAAERASTPITPEPAMAPAGFRRPDGTSTFRPVASTLFTSQAIWDAEERLLASGRADTAPTLDLTILDAVIENPSEAPLRVSADQADVLAGIAVSGRVVDLLVGPAGAGKTTTLGALRRAWELQHGPGAVTGLAPAAAAAQVLADELGIATENTAKWLADHWRGQAAFRPGGLVICDEASLAGTLTLDRIAHAARQAGAKLLLVGDPAQLQSVQAGGAFAMLAVDRDDTPTLADVHRFAEDWEKLASLELRCGNPDVIGAYVAHGRVWEGPADDVTEAAYQAWRADTTQGLSSVLIAETGQTVAELNRRARADRIAAGQVDAGPEVALADGCRASRGDVVTTRRNDRRLVAGRSGWVRNGDQWAVAQVRGDGSVTVRRLGRNAGASVVLPAAYVADHLELGYASTAHRSQGITVDTAHAVATDAATRELLYVAMTRGRRSNTVYVATDQTDPAHAAAFPNDREPDAHAVLRRALQTSSAEPSAHAAAGQEQDRWRGIAQLAAEYETIAEAALRDRYAAQIGVGDIPERVADQITASRSFISAALELSRLEASGRDTVRLLRDAAQLVAEADDPADALVRVTARERMSRPMAARPAQRLIAGLIPECVAPVADDMRAALDQRAQLIRQRATELARRATRNGEPWLRDLGPRPADRDGLRRWQSRAITVAAYRDRWNHTDPTAVRRRPASQQERIDAARARRALPQDAALVPGARQTMPQVASIRSHGPGL